MISRACGNPVEGLVDTCLSKPPLDVCLESCCSLPGYVMRSLFYRGYYISTHVLLNLFTHLR